MEKTDWEISYNCVVSESANDLDVRIYDDVVFLEKIKTSSRYYLENRHMDILYTSKEAVKKGLSNSKEKWKRDLLNSLEAAISDYIPKNCYLGMEGRLPTGRFGVWRY